MTHQIKNQFNQYIIDPQIRAEINHALEHDLDYCYWHDTKIEIIEDKKSDKEHNTLVNVGFKHE